MPWPRLRIVIWGKEQVVCFLSKKWALISHYKLYYHHISWGKPKSIKASFDLTSHSTPSTKGIRAWRSVSSNSHTKQITTVRCIVLDVLQTNNTMIMAQAIMWCRRLGSRSAANDGHTYLNTDRHSIPQQVLPNLPSCHFHGGLIIILLHSPFYLLVSVTLVLISTLEASWHHSFIACSDLRATRNFIFCCILEGCKTAAKVRTDVQTVVTCPVT